MDFAVEITRVVDGDTVDAALRVYPGHTVQARVRVLGVDSPEFKKEPDKALAAKLFTRAWLAEPGDPVSIHACAMDDFGRLLGRVCRRERCLDDVLVEARHGVRR